MMTIFGSKISLKVHHTLRGNIMEEKFRDFNKILMYSDFGSHRTLKTESSNFL
jgi:hypothetical protein